MFILVICLSAFGASSSNSPFGASPAASNPFGSTTSPFGMNQSSNLFGAKPFGSTTPFGGQTGSSLFGSGTATGVFGATPPTTFGASSRAFGASSLAPAFGSGMVYHCKLESCVIIFRHCSCGY
jgi:nuclear pore complex protein Nup98-Nup96